MSKYKQNPLPKIWDLPLALRIQLSSRGGRQRALTDDQHLVLVLHSYRSSKPSASKRLQPTPVYFWRTPEHEWHFSERGGGFQALESIVQDYEDRVIQLEEANTLATKPEQWFGILDTLTPLLRSARGVSETLLKAYEETNCGQQRELLQKVCDQASETVRIAELLMEDVRRAIQFALVRQQERQSGYIRQQSSAAHRLNVLAAVFLPVATVSSVFGMNLHHGFENWSPITFWAVLISAMVLGGSIGYFVMNVRKINPTEW